MHNKLKLWQRLQISGLILLLGSIGWQVFIADQLRDLHEDTKRYIIDQKLDNIWMYLGAIGYKIRQDEPTRVTADYAQFNESWNRLPKGEERVKSQASFAIWVTRIFYLLGTVLMLVGRYLEMKMDNMKNDNVHVKDSIKA